MRALTRGPGPALSSAGRNEDKLHHFTGTPFYQALLPETQNILRHVWQND